MSKGGRVSHTAADCTKSPLGSFNSPCSWFYSHIQEWLTVGFFRFSLVRRAAPWCVFLSHSLSCKAAKTLPGVIGRFVVLTRSPSARHVYFCFRFFWCNKCPKCSVSWFYDRSSGCHHSRPSTTTTTTTASLYSPGLWLCLPSVCSSPVAGHFALATMTSLSWAVNRSRPRVVWQQSSSSCRGKAAASHRSTVSDLFGVSEC